MGKVTYHASSLSNSANSKCNSDGSEHALVDSKQEIGNHGRANRWCSQDISEADILKITKELTRSVGESKRVTPEEPLEGDDGGGHDGEPDQGQRRLSPSQTGIEETAEGLSAFALPNHVFVYVHTRHLES